MLNLNNNKIHDEFLSDENIERVSSEVDKKLKNSKKLVQEVQQIIQRSKRYIDYLEHFMRFNTILNSTLDTQEVHQRAIEAATNLLQCDAASLYLVDEDKQELYFDIIIGEAADDIKEIRLPIDEKSIAGSIALNRKAEIINDVESDKRHFKEADKKSNFNTRNMICVPVFSKDKLRGVLQAINSAEEDFNQTDLILLETLGNQVGIALENAMLYESLRNTFMETMEAFSSAIEAKDRYTGGHTKRVALFSTLIAKYYEGFNKDDVLEVRMAAMMHDIGKIGVDDKVLKKQAPLDAEEWEHMKQHPEFGYRILGHVKSLKNIVDGMRYHHERPDGLGYPLGLKGEEIPLIARIISVADTFDAMTSTRPYRKGLSYETAYDEITRYRGTQFDEKVVDAFVKAFKLEGMGKKRKKSE